jgi:hypothetical protein
MMGLLETYPYQTLAALCFGCMMLFRQLQKGRNNLNVLPLPPGPKGYPLIGNLFNMPVDKAWLVYDEWFKTYGRHFMTNGVFLPNTGLQVDVLGDMIYLNVLGQHFLILGSLQRITDLLEKRSSNYSDRMRMPMAVELYV